MEIGKKLKNARVQSGTVSYTHLDVYKRQVMIPPPIATPMIAQKVRIVANLLLRS